MRFFSPVYLRKCELYAFMVGLNKRVSPIPVSVAQYGIVQFTPVRVNGLGLKTFDAEFLNNPFPILDADALRNSDFHFVYNKEGLLDKEISRQDKITLNTICEDIVSIRNIRIQRSVANGDILLCSRRFPRGKGLLS